MILTPKETADKVVEMGVKKCEATSFKIFLLGIMGGIFVGMGFLAYFTIIQSTSTLSIGLAKLLGASTFPLGIILCIVVGGSLYTGNNLLTLAFLNKRISREDLVRNWATVWIGNLVGSTLLAAVVYLLGTLEQQGIVEMVLKTVAAKTNIPFGRAVLSGFVCNILVSLAVWMSLSSTSLTGKVAVLWFPVMVFALVGLEHCVANMFVLIIGKMIDPGLYSVADIFTKNLIPVTIGNTLSGGLFIPVVYKMVYYRNSEDIAQEDKVEAVI